MVELQQNEITVHVSIWYTYLARDTIGTSCYFGTPLFCQLTMTSDGAAYEVNSKRSWISINLMITHLADISYDLAL